MNPFKRAYFPKYPKYAREICILTCILGAPCAVTLLIKAPAWVSALLLSMEFAVCAIGVYGIESYYRSMQ